MTETHHIVEEPAWAAGLSRGDRELVVSKTALIRVRIGSAAEAIYEIGRELRQVKVVLGRRGKWEQWLGEEFEWTDRTARRYMAVSLRMTKAAEADKLELYAPSALYVLAAESTPEAARDEADNLSASGERITYTGAQELVERHKAAQEAFDGLTPDQQEEIAAKAAALAEEEEEDDWPERLQGALDRISRLFAERELRPAANRQKVAAHLKALATLGRKAKPCPVEA